MKPLEPFKFTGIPEFKGAEQQLNILITRSNRINNIVTGFQAWLMMLTFCTTLNMVYLMIVVFWRE